MQSDDRVAASGARRLCAVCGEGRPAAFRIWYDGGLKIYRCRTCGFVSHFPGPGGDPLVTKYEDRYSLDFAENGPFMYPERRGAFADLLQRIRAKMPSGDLLDVGCGDGQFLSLCRPYYGCHGIEPCRVLADYATRIAEVPVVNAEYEADTFPGASFDVIVMAQLLEHLPSPREMLGICKHHLRGGGMVVIEVPSIRAPHFLLYQLTGIRCLIENERGVIASHCGYYEPRTLRQLVASCGYTDITVVTGRWAARYKGMRGAVGCVADPLLNALGVGGILLFAHKR